MGEIGVAQAAVVDEPEAVPVWAAVEPDVLAAAAVVRVEFQVVRDEPEAGSDDCRDAQGGFPVDQGEPRVDQALSPADRAGPVGSVADCWVDQDESPSDPDD